MKFIGWRFLDHAKKLINGLRKKGHQQLYNPTWPFIMMLNINVQLCGETLLEWISSYSILYNFFRKKTSQKIGNKLVGYLVYFLLCFSCKLLVANFDIIFKVISSIILFSIIPSKRILFSNKWCLMNAC